MIENGNLWSGLICLIGIMILCASITMFSPEVQLAFSPPKIDWAPFVRLLLMTSIFTLIILGCGRGVKQFLGFLRSKPNYDVNLLSAVAGIVSMSIAVFLGVIASLRIGLGKEINTHKPFKWWVINRLTFLVAANNLAGFLVFFLLEKFPEYSGLDVTGPASKIIMFVGIFVLLFALPSGWLADRFGKKFLCAVAGILFGIGAVIVIFSPEITGLIYLGASVAGAGLGLFHSANWALGTDLVPAKQAGKFLGLSNLAGAGAGAIGAYIGGPIGDFRSYGFLMGLFGFLAFLSIFALLGIKEGR
jgi:Na+/melibiose symporter-like transporter